MSSSSATNVIPGGDQLERLCLQQGKKARRDDPDTGDQYDIFVYSYKHGGGMAYLYVNETTNKTLEESVEWQLKGLEIEGKPGETELEFSVKPGEKKLIKLVTTEGPWKLSMGVGYEIS